MAFRGATCAISVRTFQHRKQLDIKLAVLMMRSSYEAVDLLDFMPMDKFQVGSTFKTQVAEEKRGKMVERQHMKSP